MYESFPYSLSMYHVPVEILSGLQSQASGVTEDCETPCGSWDSNSGPLEEQPMF